MFAAYLARARMGRMQDMEPNVNDMDFDITPIAGVLYVYLALYVLPVMVIHALLMFLGW
jgi:hypothetical protein